jgi:hypothetical protein
VARFIESIHAKSTKCFVPFLAEESLIERWENIGTVMDIKRFGCLAMNVPESTE